MNVTLQAKSILTMLLLIVAGLTTNAFAASDHATSITGVQGYDLVSYHTHQQPLRGSGHFVAVYDGITYLFANQENKTTFERHPERYLPAYGGYCAFGVSVGKKFVADPEVWRLVDGRLYLNLDNKVQNRWLEDISGNIKTADELVEELVTRTPPHLEPIVPNSGNRLKIKSFAWLLRSVKRMADHHRRQRMGFAEAIKLLPRKRFPLTTSVQVAKYNALGLADERV